MADEGFPGELAADVPLSGGLSGRRRRVWEWLTAWLVASACAAALAATTGSLPDRPELRWDSASYLAMARGASDNPLARRPPYCYRPLFPWLAALLPGDERSGFRLLAVLGAAVGGAGLYGCARASSFSHPLGLAAVPLFLSARYGFRCAIFDVLPEGLSLALLTWALFALLSDRIALFVTLIGVGTLVRESLGLLIVPFVVYKWRSGQGLGKILIPALMAAAAVALALTYARLRVVPSYDFSYVGYLLRSARIHWLHPGGPARLVLAVCVAAGVPLYLVLLHAPAAWRHLCEQMHWIAYVLVFLAFTFSVPSDEERFTSYLLPAIVLLALAIVRDRRATLGRPLVAVGLVILHAISQRLFSPLPTDIPSIASHSASSMSRDVLLLAIVREAALFSACALLTVLPRLATRPQKRGANG